MGVPGGAVRGGGSDDGLGDGAGAVGDGEGGGLEEKWVSFEFRGFGSRSRVAGEMFEFADRNRDSHSRLHHFGWGSAHLGDGVGLGAVSDDGGSGAVGGVGSDDLGGVDHGVV